VNAFCGIVGHHSHEVVDKMARAMRHRANVVQIHRAQDYAVAASHPIADPVTLLDGTPRLKSTGPLSPTLLHRYIAERTPQSRNTLRGAYAAALEFENGKRWLLIRDSLGRRPLYYYHGNGILAFASELKALLASGLMPKRLNLLAVDRYLTLRCVPGRESIISGINRVEPGQQVELKNGHIVRQQSILLDLRSHDIPKEKAAEELRSTLFDVLERDAGESVLWSAGIDCASIAALRPALSPVFVSLESAWQDEARLAGESARLMNRPLTKLNAPRFTEESVHAAVRALDEPIGDPSVFPLWLIAEALSADKSRFVSGHGADELLGGYPRYNFMQKAHGARRLLPTGLLADLMPALPPNAFIRRGSRYLTSMHDPQESYLSLVSVFDREEREDLYTDAMKSAVYDLGAGIPAIQEHFTEGDLTRNVLSLDLHIGIPYLLMAKCDRIAAAHGLDIQHPYLDDDVVEFALGISPKSKYGIRSKPLLRMAMRNHLPGSVRIRARRDFQIPQHGRPQRVIERIAKQVITPEYVDATGLFRWQAIRKVIGGGLHNVYRRRQYWALVMLFAWYHNMMES